MDLHIFNEKWNYHELILINSSEEYKNIEVLSDTTYEWYRPNSLKYDIDFNKYTLIGLKTQTPIVKFKKQVFKNILLKQYQYFVTIISPFNEIRVSSRKFNFLLIPKIDSSYKVLSDTVQVWEN